MIPLPIILGNVCDAATRYVLAQEDADFLKKYANFLALPDNLELSVIIDSFSHNDFVDLLPPWNTLYGETVRARYKLFGTDYRYLSYDRIVKMYRKVADLLQIEIEEEPSCFHLIAR